MTEEQIDRALDALSRVASIEIMPDGQSNPKVALREFIRAVAEQVQLEQAHD